MLRSHRSSIGCRSAREWRCAHAREYSDHPRGKASRAHCKPVEAATRHVKNQDCRLTDEDVELDQRGGGDRLERGKLARRDFRAAATDVDRASQNTAWRSVRTQPSYLPRPEKHPMVERDAQGGVLEAGRRGDGVDEVGPAVRSHARERNLAAIQHVSARAEPGSGTSFRC